MTPEHAGVAQLVEQRTCQNGLIGRTYIERCEAEVQVFFLAPVMRKSWVRVPSPAPLNRLLAQLVELPAHNRMVSGSSPGQPTKCRYRITVSMPALQAGGAGSIPATCSITHSGSHNILGCRQVERQRTLTPSQGLNRLSAGSNPAIPAITG